MILFWSARWIIFLVVILAVLILVRQLTEVIYNLYLLMGGFPKFLFSFQQWFILSGKQLRKRIQNKIYRNLIIK